MVSINISTKFNNIPGNNYKGAYSILVPALYRKLERPRLRQGM